MEELAWFVASLRLTMRARYQASNSLLADALSEFSRRQGLDSDAKFSGSALKGWGDPKNTDSIRPAQLQAMLAFYIDRQLVPDSALGWRGLIHVHRQLNGPDTALPAYLDDHGAASWLTLVTFPRKEHVNV